MKRLDVRRVAILLVCVLAIGLVVHLMHSVQVRRSESLFRKEATTAKEAGQPAEAVRHLQLYLELVPGDADAIGDLGLLLADLSKNRAARRTLEKAVRMAPDRVDTRRRLVEVAVTTGRYIDAEEHLVPLLEKNSQDAELLELRGRCHEALGRYEQARGCYQQAIDAASERLATYARLARLFRRRLERPDEADTVMEQLVASNPDSPEARLMLSDYLLNMARRPQEALQRAEEALRLNADNPDAILLASRCALETEQYDLARQRAERVIQLDPQRAYAFLLMAEIELRSGSRQDAILWVRKGLEATPDDGELLWSLANLLLDEGEVDAAKKPIDDLARSDYSPARVDYLKARLDLAQGQWLAASARLAKVRGRLANWPSLAKYADYYLGTCYGQLGNVGQQLVAFRRAVNDDPLWSPARQGLARALVSQGRLDQALEEYRQLMKLQTAPASGWLEMARLTYFKNLRASPEAQNWSEAQAALDNARRATPDSSAVAILQAELLYAQGQEQKAEACLAGAVQDKPGDVGLRVASSALAQRRGDWPKAERWLDEAQSRLGPGVEIRLARAQYLARRLGEEAAEQVRALETDAAQLGEPEQVRLWWGLAATALRIGDYDFARQMYRKLSAATPNNLRIHLHLFDLALRAKDETGVAQNLEEIDRIEGQGPHWRYGRAVYLSLRAREGDDQLLDEALGHLSEAAVRFPSWSSVPRLAADLHFERGDEASAMEHYLRAIELGERSPRAVSRLVQLLMQRQRYVEADHVIRQLEQQQTPFSAGLSRMASEISLRLEEYGRALEMARRAAEDSTDYRDHLWLGSVLSVEGQRESTGENAEHGPEPKEAPVLEQAEHEFRQAVELSDNATDAWVALIRFLGRTQQTQQAEEALEEARQKIPPEQATFALAPCYEILERLEEAETSYRQALAASPDDPVLLRAVAQFFLRQNKVQLAEPHLWRIARGEVDAPEADRLWGRRSLAVILGRRPGYENLCRALELVDQNLRASDSSLPDKRLKASLLARHPKRQKLEEAIRVFEGILRDSTGLDAKDRFQLARLYLAKGDWINASRQMRTLLASSGREPRYVASYIQALLNHNEIREAELWLARLQQLVEELEQDESASEKSFTTVRLRAEVSFLRRRFDEAIATLKAYLKNPDAKPADPVARLRLVATAMASFSLKLRAAQQEEAAADFTREAEALFRQTVQDHPERQLILATFLATHGRAKEALDLVEQSWQQSDLASLTLALRIVGGPILTAGHDQQRLERVLVAAIEKHDRPTPLLHLLADLRVRQQQHNEAATIYREILGKNERDVLAMNNLASVLALQKENLAEARQLVDRAVQIAGPVTNVLDSRAAVSLAAGEPQKAIADLEEAIADRPSATSYLRLAQAFTRVGRGQDAREALRRAQERGLDRESLHPVDRPVYDEVERSLR